MGHEVPTIARHPKNCCTSFLVQSAGASQTAATLSDAAVQNPKYCTVDFPNGSASSVILEVEGSVKDQILESH